MTAVPNLLPKLLIVEDDATFGSVLKVLFDEEGLDVVWARDLSGARTHLDHRPDIVILDQRLPDGSGLALIDEVNAANPLAKILVTTANGSVDDAVFALKKGIVDYLAKPVDLEALRLAVLRTLEHGRLAQSLEADRRQSRPRELTGHGTYSDSLKELVARAALSRAPVLITGETGTGKTLIAKTIHQQGPNSARPFVAVNCSAIPDNLVEAELLGVERGAYTGAHAARPGLFELADQGTLFLDEIGEMSLPLQAKLLSVIEDGVVRRLGSTRPRHVDVRIVAATNASIDLRSNRIRQDLLYRLDVLRINLRPLRERQEELGAIVLGVIGGLAGTKAVRLADGEMSRLARYAWPGNIRELRNVVERALLLGDAAALRPSTYLSVDDNGAVEETPTSGGEVETLAALERRHVLAVLDLVGGARELAAKRLGIAPATLRRKLASWNR